MVGLVIFTHGPVGVALRDCGTSFFPINPHLRPSRSIEKRIGRAHGVLYSKP